MKCLICGSEQCEFINTFERLNVKHTLYNCKVCESFFIDNVEEYNLALADYYKTKQTPEILGGMHYRFLHRAQRQISFIEKNIDLSKTSVFEFGAGFGMTGYVLKNKVPRYLAFDYDTNRKKYAENFLGVEYTKSFEEWIDAFKKTSGSKILYMSQAIEFITDLAEILKPITARNHNDVYIYINFMNAQNPAYQKTLADYLPGYGIIWYSLNSLEKILGNYGFVLINTTSISFEKTIQNELQKIPVYNKIHNRFIGEKAHKKFKRNSKNFNDGLFIDALFKLTI